MNPNDVASTWSTYADVIVKDATERIVSCVDEWAEALVNAIECARPRQIVALPSGTVINLATFTHAWPSREWVSDDTPIPLFVLMFGSGSSVTLRTRADIAAAKRALGIEAGTEAEHDPN
jgi:hypothetical protein